MPCPVSGNLEMDSSIDATMSGTRIQEEILTGSDNTDEAVPNPIMNVKDELIGVDQAHEVIEDSATVVPSAPRILDADAESQFGSELIFMLILVPVFLLTVLCAWYALKRRKPRGFTDPDSARGRFKKSDRLQRSLQPDSAGGTAEVKPKANEEFSTTTDFSVSANENISKESGELSFSEEDEEVMFGAGKEAALDQWLDQGNPPASENEPSAAAANAPAAPAPVADAESNPTRTVWRKKKFPPKKCDLTTGPTAGVATSKPVNQDRSTDQRGRTTAASKTVVSELTLAEPDSFEFADDFANDEAESVERLEKENAKLRRQSEEQECQLVQAGERASKLIEEIVELEERSKEFESVMADHKQLSEELSEQRSKTDQLARLLENSQEQRKEWEDERVRFRLAEDERVRFRLAESDRGLTQAQSEIDKLTASVSLLEQQKTDLQAESKQLELLIEKKTTNAKELAEKLKMQANEAAELKQRLETETTKSVELQEKLASLDVTRSELELATAQEHDQLKADLEAVQLEKAELAAKLDAECVRANALEERSAQLDDKIAQTERLENQIEALKKELDDARAQVGPNDGKSESPSELISDKTKTKFTQLYRAYERERQLREELEVNLEQAEEQRDQVANELREWKKNQNS